MIGWQAGGAGHQGPAGRETVPDAIRGVAILCVVAIHGFAYLGLPTGGAWALPWRAVSELAVPVFFLVDGWLAARRPPTGDREAALAGLRASAWRLMLPWAAFSALFLGLRLAAEAAGRAGGAPVLPDGVADLPAAVWHGAAAGHLYFLPALLLTRAAAVPLLPRLRRRPLAAALVAAGLVLGWRLGLEPLLPRPERGVDPLLAAATGLGFAAMGWALAAREARVPGGAGRAALAASVLLALPALVLGEAGAGAVARTLGQAAWVLAAWAAVTWIAAPRSGPSGRRTAGAGALLAAARPGLVRGAAWLGRRTMEVYLLHGLALRPLAGAALALGLPEAIALSAVVLAATLAALGLAAALRRLGLAWLWDPPRRLGAAPRPALTAARG